MSGLTSRRALFRSASTLGALTLLSGCPRPTQVVEVAPDELLAGTGLSAPDIDRALVRLRMAGLSEGEVYIQRRLTRIVHLGAEHPAVQTRVASGIALRVVRDGAEVDTAIGRLTPESLDKLLTRVGIDPTAPLAPTTDLTAATLLSGEDHPASAATPDTAELATLHLALVEQVADTARLESRCTVLEDSVVVATIDGRLHRRVGVFGRLDLSMSQGDRRGTVTTELLGLLGLEDQSAHTNLIERLKAIVATPPAVMTRGAHPVLLHAGGGAEWVAGRATASAEGPGLVFGHVDDTGDSPDEVESVGPVSTRFRPRFDADLVAHPRALTLAAEDPQPAADLIDGFTDGLRVVRLSDLRREGAAMVGRVAEGWWHQTGQPPRPVPDDTRLHLPDDLEVQKVGDDGATDHLDRLHTAASNPLLEVTHPTLLLAGARVEAPHA